MLPLQHLFSTLLFREYGGQYYTKWQEDGLQKLCEFLVTENTGPMVLFPEVLISTSLQEKYYLLGDLSVKTLARVTHKFSVFTVLYSIRRDTKSECVLWRTL